MNYSTFFDSIQASTALIYFSYCPADNRVLYVSSAYERVLGGSVASVNADLPSWLAALQPDDRAYLAERIAYAAAGGQVEDVRLRLHRPANAWRWLSLTAAGCPAADSTGPTLVNGFLLDITESQNVLDMANRYQAKKNAMLEIMSHDLATPLTLAEQIADYLGEKEQLLTDSEALMLLAQLRRTCRGGINLIRDFVDREFLDSTSIDLKKLRLDLAAKLRGVVSEYAQHQQAAGHQFTFHSSHPSIYADLDENKFLQVINNLVGNAIKFTPDGCGIRVQPDQHPDHLLLSVADSGIGIPAELLPGLFERFTDARRVGLRGEKTTGLGMSIIKAIVELHHGQIWVESQVNQGSTFFIRLPRLAGD